MSNKNQKIEVEQIKSAVLEYWAQTFFNCNYSEYKKNNKDEISKKDIADAEQGLEEEIARLLELEFINPSDVLGYCKISLYEDLKDL